MNDPQTEFPAKFRTASGREYVLRLTTGRAMRTKQRHGLDLLDVAQAGEGLAKLEGDPVKLCTIAADLLSDDGQIGKDEASQNAFFDDLDGDAIDGLFDALMGALVAFSPGHRRRALQAVARKMKQAMQAGGKAAEARIEAIDPQALTTSGSGSTSAPESPA